MKSIILAVSVPKTDRVKEYRLHKIKQIKIIPERNLICIDGRRYRLSSLYILVDDVIKISPYCWR